MALERTYKPTLRISRRHLRLALPAAIIVVGAALRLAGIAKGLPYLYYPDEPRHVEIAQRMFRQSSLNPGVFFYPAVFFYLNALSYVPYFLLGRLTGSLHGLDDLLAPSVINLGVGFTPLPTTFLLGRCLTAICGTFAIAVLIRIGHRLYPDRRVGYLAGLLLAVSPTNVEYSRYLFPHELLVLTVLIAFLVMVETERKRRVRDYVLSGIACGFAASTMYTGVVVACVLPLVAFFEHGLRALYHPKLLLGAVTCVAAFLLLNPFMIVDGSTFLRDSTFIVGHYLSGSAGTDHAGLGNALSWYVDYVVRVEGPLAILVALGLVRGIMRGTKGHTMVGGFVAPYFVLISSAVVRNARTLLPITPFLFLILSAESFGLISWLRTRAVGFWQWSRIPASVALLFLMLLPWSETTRQTSRVVVDDSRETARNWIERNLEPGSRIALEAYAPYLSPTEFDVVGIERLINHAPAWYVDQDFDYLVFGQGMFERFYLEPDTYADCVGRYEELFRTFERVRTFRDGDYEVMIYHVAE